MWWGKVTLFECDYLLQLEEKERHRLHKLELLAAARLRKQLEDEERERLHKTKEYIQLDYLMRPSPEEGTPMYYGENIASVHGPWVPHGKVWAITINLV